MDKNINKYKINEVSTNIEDKNKDRAKKEIKIINKRKNHITIESNYEKSSSKKVLEKKVENTQIIPGNEYKNNTINIQPKTICKDDFINSNIIYNNKAWSMNNIKSKYILEEIFTYIADINFKYKLFNYSKLLQNRFEISLNDYITKYKEQLNYEKLVDQELISSSSPLFKNLISKDTLYILQDNLEKNDYKRKYCEILNKPHLNYSSIYYNFNNKNFEENFLDNLNELKIDFSKIKSMTLNAEKYIPEEMNFKTMDFNRMKAMVLHPDFFIRDNYNFFLKNLFTLNNIRNNLIHLKIFFYHKHCVIKSDSFNEINNMKALKYLYLKNLNFDRHINISLNNLKILYCNKCKNANYININCKNLKKLFYIDNYISDLNNINKKLEKLEVLDLNNNNISHIDFSKFINCEELKELNLSNNEISDINILKDINFNELKIFNLSNNKITDIGILEKVKFDNLDELNLSGNNVVKNQNLLKIKTLFKNKLILN